MINTGQSPVTETFSAGVFDSAGNYIPNAEMSTNIALDPNMVAGPGLTEAGAEAASSGITSGFAVGAGTAAVSYVGGLLQGKDWNDSNLLADSAGNGIGAGIGWAIGSIFGPVGAMIGGTVGSMVLGKWAGNAVDAIGDGIGEALEFLKFW
jgi:hypothetical protein